MNKGHKLDAHESMDEELVPDEFSDDGAEDDVGYEEVEEKFQPRESISSRGGAGRRAFQDTNRIQTKTVDTKPQNRIAEVRQAEESYSPGDKSSSVISEVVENQVVYLDSDKDEDEEKSADKFDKQATNDRDKQIQEYLDIDKNDYVNKDEYQDGPQDEEPELTEEQQKQIDELEQRKQQLLQEKDELEGIIDDLNGQLEQASPIYGEALKNVDTLSRRDISDLKSFSKPPHKVKITVEAAMILLQEQTDWRSFQKLAATPSAFITRLKHLDKDNIPEETIDTLDDFIEENDLSNIQLIANTSKTAASLASWVIGINNYAHILQTLKPLIDRKKEAEEILTQKIVEIQKIEQAQQDILSGKEYNQEESEIKHAGLQTSFDGSKHTLQYEMQNEDGESKRMRAEVEADYYEDQFEQQPIESEQQDVSKEEYKNRGPDIDAESLYYITNEIKQKDQSKKFVLWETNEMRNQWDDRQQPENKKQGTMKTNSHHWTHEPSEKSVSVIDSRKPKGKPKNMPQIYDVGDAFAKVPKKDHYINNVFLQSNLQDRFEEQTKKEKAPLSHNSYNKNEKSKKYMVEGRPLFEGQGNHVQNINAGRSRIFYSSNVF